MARPRRCRRICAAPAYDGFVPQGIAAGAPVTLALDEFEVIRLIDHERLTHEQCACMMDISRTTVTEIYAAARAKLAESLVNGRPLYISGQAGGGCRFCDGSAARFCHTPCHRQRQAGAAPAAPRKGETIMRIAVTYQNGEVYQHFGHTQQFKLYDVQNGSVQSATVVSTSGQGHGALAGFLQQAGADVVICGGIGGGAQAALAQAGIQLFGGVAGNADQAVQAYLAGSLRFDPAAQCHGHHHGEGHSCGGHHGEEHGCGHHHGEGHCGEDKHGCAGSC